TGSQLFALNGNNSLNAYNVKVNTNDSQDSPIYSRLAMAGQGSSLNVDLGNTAAWNADNTIAGTTYATNEIAPQLLTMQTGEGKQLTFVASPITTYATTIANKDLNNQTHRVNVTTHPYANVTLQDQAGKIIAKSKADSNGNVTFSGVTLAPNSVLVAVATYVGMPSAGTKYVVNSQVAQDDAAISSANSIAVSAASAANNAASSANASASAAASAADSAYNYKNAHSGSLNDLESRIADAAKDDAQSQSSTANNQVSSANLAQSETSQAVSTANAATS
ncbi:hypothetical protein, partial [Limosilactobacillus reuteri]